MIDPAMLQSFSYVAASMSVVVAAFYYALSLRNANRTRQTELFMKLYDRWNEKGFQKQWMDVVYQWGWKDYDDFEIKYGSGNTEAFSSSFSVSAFFEGVGVLVKRKRFCPVCV